MNKPRVSVIIRSFNEEKHIGRLLYGIGQQTVDDPEIVVVDSGSTDGTLEIARQFPTRILEIEPDEFTFGRALNVGCSNAHGQFLVFASAHVYPVYNDWLATLLEPFADPAVGAVYGKQRGNEETAYSEKQIFKQLYPDEDILKQETPFCNNANCAIRRSLWEEEPYNEDLTGLEDLEWARRIMRKGYRIYYSADAEIVHVHDETPAEVHHRYMREAIALGQLYPDRGMSWWKFLRLFAKNSFNDYVHAFKEGELFSNLLDIPRFRLMQFLGAYRGFQRTGPVPARLHRRFYYPKGYSQEDEGVRDEDSQRKIDYRVAS